MDGLLHMGMKGKGAAVALPLFLTALAGCSSTNSSLLDKLSLSTKPAAATDATTTANAAVAAQQPDDFDCPDIQIRGGASTLMIGDKPAGSGEPNALNLKYQGTITRTARECHVAAGTVTMKIGIEGRVITGPAGGPGQIDVPVRMAVVHEGPEPRTVVSKLYRLPVTIAEGQGGATFTEIDPDVAFPLPQPVSVIDAYVVYVGFDPLANRPEKKPKPSRKPRARSRAAR
ncbi:MAG TPA: hypothetical protein VFX37_15585 [Pseudolabrys sp.]|nr:hypothetical protein [Pseudolabrys sp.]